MQFFTRVFWEMESNDPLVAGRKTIEIHEALRRVPGVRIQSCASLNAAMAPEVLSENSERAVRAFDALLAVAQAVTDPRADWPPGSWPGTVVDAVMRLDTEHPGWREWA